MRAWIDQHGGDSKTIRIVELPASASTAALDEGRVDAATVFEPALTQALQTGKYRILGRQFDSVAGGQRFEQTAFAGVAGWVERSRDAATRFARAMHESILYTTRTSRTVDLVASYTNVIPTSSRSVRYVDAEYVEPAIRSRCSTCA